MTGLKPTTRQQLQLRRQQLRQKMRRNLRSRIWRFALTAGLLAGGIYCTRLPVWKIQQPNSFRIEGNRILADSDILESLPPLDSLYIWQVEPSQLELAMLSHPLLQAATVRRQLIPPRILARVQERQAIAVGDVAGVSGFIDTEGHWLDRAALPEGKIPEDWPALKAMGWQKTRETDWAELLFVLQHSTVAIHEVDWRSSANLILQTDLGEVHFGPVPEGTLPDTPRGQSPLGHAVRERLESLHQLQPLYDSICDCQPEDVEYIDLSQPHFPTLSLTDSAAKARFSESEQIDDASLQRLEID